VFVSWAFQVPHRSMQPNANEEIKFMGLKDDAFGIVKLIGDI
jgi:hypothetical protein